MLGAYRAEVLGSGWWPETERRRRHVNGTVVITGGASGIGAAIARRIVANGGTVMVADVRPEEAERTAIALGPRALSADLDVTDAEGWRRVIDETERTFGPVHGLVNNAGILEMTPIAEVERSSIERILSVNVTGVILGMQAALPSMRRGGGGAIVNMSSAAGLTGSAYFSAYAGSKWAVRGITKCAALELAEDRVRVNSVHPGPVTTPMTEHFPPDVCSDQPIPRLGRAEEVAGLVEFLLSADSEYCTGSEFVVDGGRTAGRTALAPER